MAGDAGGVRAADPGPRGAGRGVRHTSLATTRRLVTLLLVAAASAVLAASAGGALFFLFEPTVAKPGDRVIVRLGGTPASFTQGKRVKPLRRPIRVYLVPNRIAQEVRTRFDSRLRFVGQIVPDRNLHGIVTFTAPPLDTDTYIAAAWCPECARYSGGRAFSVLPLPEVSRFRELMALRVEMPSPARECPVSIPRGGKPGPSSQPSTQWHGNGLLWTWLPLDGTFRAQPENEGWPGDPPGSIATKLYWFAKQGYGLTLSGERLDAEASPLVVHRVNSGQSSSWAGPTWATPVTFPNVGCWRLTARLQDVTLSYVLKVVRG